MFTLLLAITVMYDQLFIFLIGMILNSLFGAKEGLKYRD